MIPKRQTAFKHCTVRKGEKETVCVCVIACVQHHPSESYRGAQKLSQGTQQRCHSFFWLQERRRVRKVDTQHVV